jgi:hypothetical protein
LEIEGLEGEDADELLKLSEQIESEIEALLAEDVQVGSDLTAPAAAAADDEVSTKGVSALQAASRQQLASMKETLADLAAQGKDLEAEAVEVGGALEDEELQQLLGLGGEGGQQQQQGERVGREGVVAGLADLLGELEVSLAEGAGEEEEDGGEMEGGTGAGDMGDGDDDDEGLESLLNSTGAALSQSASAAAVAAGADERVGALSSSSTGSSSSGRGARQAAAAGAARGGADGGGDDEDDDLQGVAASAEDESALRQLLGADEQTLTSLLAQLGAGGADMEALAEGLVDDEEEEEDEEDGEFGVVDLLEAIDEDPSLTADEKMQARMRIQGMYNDPMALEQGSAGKGKSKGAKGEGEGAVDVAGRATTWSAAAGGSGGRGRVAAVEDGLGGEVEPPALLPKPPRIVKGE